MTYPWERHSSTEWRITHGAIVIASIQCGALGNQYASLSIRARPERKFRGVIGSAPLDETGQPLPLPSWLNSMIYNNWPEAYENN